MEEGAGAAVTGCCSVFDVVSSSILMTSSVVQYQCSAS